MATEYRIKRLVDQLLRDKNTRTCGHCVHYQEHHDETERSNGSGLCYRYPPSAVSCFYDSECAVTAAVSDGVVRELEWEQPLVYIDRRACGEFAPDHDFYTELAVSMLDDIDKAAGKKE